MRSFRTPFGRRFLSGYQKGSLAYRYKELPCLKSPIDLAIYLRLLGTERPKTIFEVGSKAGGSALLFRDLARLFQLDARIVSIDLSPPSIEDEDGIRFVRGDVLHLDEVFEREHLFPLERPWLVVEDSAHTRDGCLAALAFFADHLRAGELIVIEDGVLSDLGLARRYGGGPNRAIAEFFEARPGVFEIATEYTDMFGRNATYNPNGYLRRRAGDERS
ncbi:MAG: cephalosporin hydroxylase [Acidobacteria bacterium]|nr:MAG: cephalosporin hydroxylase [Acidobacteriota bacterium]REK09786.1 MAG: cephalosporin hydroxylase [Acidobacteriota bacterium]